MLCCSNCFADAEIKAIINGNKAQGDCDFCGSKNTLIYEIGKDQIIEELFEGLLDIYIPVVNLPDTFPKGRTDLLKNILIITGIFLRLGLIAFTVFLLPFVRSGIKSSQNYLMVLLEFFKPGL